MSIPVLMPALSPTMEEGTLARWRKKEGAAVTSGDILAEIETDKATMEVEAVDEGTLGKILVGEGTEGVKVNVPIAVILEDGESADDIGDVSAASSSASDVPPAVNGSAPEPVAAAAPAPAPALATHVARQKCPRARRWWKPSSAMPFVMPWLRKCAGTTPCL